MCPCPGEAWLSQHRVAGKPQAAIKATHSGADRAVKLEDKQMVLSKILLGGHRRLCRGSRRMDLWFAKGQSGLSVSESTASDCLENELSTVKSLGYLSDSHLEVWFGEGVPWKL